MNLELMFSSKSMEWATPQDFFDKLNEEFNFTLDPAADDFNHKCASYYTEEQNGLAQDWGGAGRVLQPSVWQAYWGLGQKVC